jgi:hypothetical protein
MIILLGVITGCALFLRNSIRPVSQAEPTVAISQPSPTPSTGTQEADSGALDRKTDSSRQALSFALIRSPLGFAGGT